MYKHDVTYQLDDLKHVVTISEEGLQIFHKSKELVKFTAEEFEKMIDDYEEINK